MKQFRQQHKQQMRPKKNLLLVGTASVIEALQEGKSVDKIYINNKVSEKNFSEVLTIAQKESVPVQKVPPEKLAGFNVGENDGCIGLLSKIKYQDLQAVIDWVNDKGEPILFVILDGVTDVRNIGGIARSAYAMGAQALIIPDKGVGALNEDAILTSAGALEKLAVCRVNSLMKAVDTLHLNGVQVYASEMTATKTIRELDMSIPCAVIMGGEENGVFPALMKICDATFNIPMHNDFESLNVSVAAGIILYEAQLQRK